MGGTLNIGSIKHEASPVDNMTLGTDGSLTFGGEVRTPNETLTGQHPGISFVNSEFEVDTTGWNLYANTASTVPTDGKAGGYTVGTTFTASDTLPLMGLRSGLFSKDANNRQGKGVSYDFTVSRGNTVGPIEIRFLYETSASYVSGDMKVYIFDVTNNTVMYPSIIDIPATNNAPAIFKSVFLPSTSNSYRLIFHVATTNASAYTLKLDNIKVGEQTTAVGAAVGNWTAYTPTFPGTTIGSGTSSLRAFWRRVGASMEIVIHIRFGTSMSMPSMFLAEIPSGYTFDSTKLAGHDGGYARLGVLNAYDVTSNIGYSGTVTIDGTSTTRVRGGIDSFGGSLGTSVPFTWATGDELSLNFSAPLSQWTSNINLANDFTEYAYNSSTTATSDISGSYYALGQEGTLFRAFAPTGTNAIAKRVQFSRPVLSTDLIFLEVYKPESARWMDATSAMGYSFQQNDAGTVFYGMIAYASTSVSKNQVDVFFYSKPDKEPGLTWENLGNNGWRWRVRKVSNGNMAEVPPVVKFTANSPTTDGIDTLPAGNYTLKFSSVVTDSHSAYNASTGAYTVPIAGEYLVMLNVTLYGDATSTRNDNNIRVVKNSTDPAVRTYFSLPTRATMYYYPVSTSIRITCVAGDVLTPIINMAVTSGCLGGDPTHFQITRIGS